MSSRKRKALSLKEKMEVLKQVDENFNMKRVDLARKLHLPLSTLTTIIYGRKKIEEDASASVPSASKKLRVQKGKFAEVEEVVLEHFRQYRARSIPISGPLVVEKAKEAASLMSVENGQFSNGWLHRFKARHGISSRVISGESASVNLETVEHWKNEVLPETILGYEAKNVFNCDETGLFYNLLPSKTLAFKMDSCHGGKKSKSRLSVLLCANADGTEKHTPFVIGKAKKPRCFKNVKTLPVQYAANKSSWMTAVLFTDWLKQLDKRMKKEKRKILLFMDNCSAHPEETAFLKNVEVIFFPANCTSHLQPLDLGVIKNMKHHYKKGLVRLALDSIDSGGKAEDMKINVLEGINLISKAWQAVSAKTIRNCFHNGGFTFQIDEECEKDTSTAEEVAFTAEDWEKLSSELNFEEFVDLDEDVATTSPANVQTIEDIISEKENHEGSESDEDESPEIPVPTFKEAMAGMEMVRQYFMNHEISEKQIFAFNNMQSELCELRAKNKQQKILDFFQKQI